MDTSKKIFRRPPASLGPPSLVLVTQAAVYLSPRLFFF